MPTAASVTIDAPIETVWATLTDDAKVPLWTAGFPVLSYPEGSRRADPTGQAFILSFPAFGRHPTVGRHREVRGEYVLFSPPARLVVRCDDEEKTSAVTYALTQEGSRTSVTVSWESQHRSAVLEFFGRVLGFLYRAMAKSSLSRLKDLVERG